jgi:hypothetical protein
MAGSTAIARLTHWRDERLERPVPSERVERQGVVPRHHRLPELPRLTKQRSPPFRSQHRHDVRLLERRREAEVAKEAVDMNALGQLGTDHLDDDATTGGRQNCVVVHAAPERVSQTHQMMLYLMSIPQEPYAYDSESR